MGIEFEMKYRATPELLETIDKEVPGKRWTVAMETTYYDTKDKALSARHYTLRRRRENDQSVCTLKTPTKGRGRAEYEVLRDTIEEALPELCKLSGISELTVLTAEGLYSVCGAKFTRIAKTVELPGCKVELALDEGVLTGGGKQIPLCEVEVEHKAGSYEETAAYANALAARFGLQPEPLSKFRRALDLACEEGE